MSIDPKTAVYLDQGKLPPELERAVKLIEALPPNLTLEELQAQHDLERQQACDELEVMAKQFADAEAKRKKHWGSKFPPVLGALPPKINQVKAGRLKKAKKRKK